MLLWAFYSFCSQDINQAEEFFKKMNGKLLNAKTLQVNFKTIDEKGKIVFEGALFTEAPRKIHLRCKWSSERMLADTQGEKLLISDGNKFRCTYQDKWPAQKYYDSLSERDAPSEFDKSIIGYLTQIGMANAFTPTWIESCPEYRDDSRKRCRLGNFQIVGNEQMDNTTALIIKYTVILFDSDYSVPIASHMETFDTELWINPATNLPIKRKNGSVTEFYDDIKLDQNINGVKFALPKDFRRFAGRLFLFSIAFLVGISYLIFPSKLRNFDWYWFAIFGWSPKRENCWQSLWIYRIRGVLLIGISLYMFFMIYSWA